MDMNAMFLSQVNLVSTLALCISNIRFNITVPSAFMFVERCVTTKMKEWQHYSILSHFIGWQQVVVYRHTREGTQARPDGLRMLTYTFHSC